MSDCNGVHNKEAVRSFVRLLEAVRTQEMSLLSFTGGDETTAMFVHLTQKALTFNTRNKIIIKVFCGHKLPLT